MNWNVGAQRRSGPSGWNAAAQAISDPLARSAANPLPLICWQFANCIGNPTFMLSSDFVRDCCGGGGKSKTGSAFQVFGFEQCSLCPLPPGKVHN